MSRVETAEGRALAQPAAQRLPVIPRRPAPGPVRPTPASIFKIVNRVYDAAGYQYYVYAAGPTSSLSAGHFAMGKVVFAVGRGEWVNFHSAMPPAGVEPATAGFRTALCHCTSISGSGMGVGGP